MAVVIIRSMIWFHPGPRYRSHGPPVPILRHRYHSFAKTWARARGRPTPEETGSAHASLHGSLRARERRTLPEERFVRSMFDRVAPRYDLLNRIMAANLDK